MRYLFVKSQVTQCQFERVPGSPGVYGLFVPQWGFLIILLSPEWSPWEALGSKSVSSLECNWHSLARDDGRLP